MDHLFLAFYQVDTVLQHGMACGLTALMVSRGGTMLLQTTPAFVRRESREQNLLRVVCGCVAGLALGLCEPIWHQVAIVNVWALSTLLVAAILALLMRWSAEPMRTTYLSAAFLLFGLLLTNSQSWLCVSPTLVLWVMLTDSELGRDLFAVAAILAITQAWTGVLPFFCYFSNRNVPLLIAFVPLGIWALVTVRTRRFGSEWKIALACGAFFLAGTGLCFYSALASMTNPPLNWAYPRTVDGFFHLVKREQYDKLWPVTDLGKFMGELWVFALEAGRQYDWFYVIFIPLPFLLLRRADCFVRRWMIGLTGVGLCAGPVLVAMLNPSSDRMALGIVKPCYSALYVVLAIWTGLGMMTFGALVSKSTNTMRPKSRNKA